MNMNQCLFTANLVADPEVRELPSGSKLTNFRGAVERRFKVNNEWQKETAFLDFKAWDRVGEQAASLHKGDKVIINCVVQQDTWETEAGEKRSKVVFKVNDVEKIVVNKRAVNETEDEPQSEKKAAASRKKAAAAAVESDENDIPF